MEVPEMTFSVLLPPVQTDLMFKPGAKMSTHFPKLLFYGKAAYTESAQEIGLSTARVYLPEVSPLVSRSGSADGDGLLGSSGRVFTSILVVVTGSDGNHRSSGGSIDGLISSLGFTSTEGHGDDCE